jgi:hypothetical protein
MAHILGSHLYVSADPLDLDGVTHHGVLHDHDDVGTAKAAGALELRGMDHRRQLAAGTVAAGREQEAAAVLAPGAGR